MTQDSTIVLERPTPKIARVTFANPPVNLIVSETVTRLDEIVRELDDDPDIQVIVFTSGLPDFFFNHFDLAASAAFPVPEGEDAVPTWTDIVLRLSKAPYITIASIRGRTRGGGNELALAFDLRYASREKAMFGQPEVGSGLLPGGGGTERLPRFIGRDRALEVILSSDDCDASTAERWGWITRALPDAELDGFVDTMAARLGLVRPRILGVGKGHGQPSVASTGRGPGDRVQRVRALAHATRLSVPRSERRSARRPGWPRLRVPDGRLHRDRQPTGLIP
jgi:enoyl-CoA hydratase/carnithine racemase